MFRKKIGQIYISSNNDSNNNDYDGDDDNDADDDVGDDDNDDKIILHHEISHFMPWAGLAFINKLDSGNSEQGGIDTPDIFLHAHLYHLPLKGNNLFFHRHPRAIALLALTRF